MTLKPQIHKTLIASAVALSVAGCAMTDEYGYQRPATETEKGLGIGAAAGAITGALIGSGSGDAAEGALIGAVGGAILGGAVGNYMEQQRRDFQRVLAPEMTRGDIIIRPLPDDQLLVRMTSMTAFEVDSAQIKPGFYGTLNRIADVVNRYGKTQLVITGHTDSTGSEAYNQQLSMRRAAAVDNYLRSVGVVPERLTSIGYGESRPVATNSTEAGRRLNRRVDITIIPVVVRRQSGF